MSSGIRAYKWDCLRIIACCAVVLLHVSASYLTVLDVNDTVFPTMVIYNGFTKFAVPVFFMLSGLFLLSPDRDMSISDVFGRCLKLLLAFYIWSAFYAFQGIALRLVTHKEISKELISDSLVNFLLGHQHMWFVITLAGFYLMLPIARCISRDMKVLTYFCVFWIVLRFIIPFIYTYCSLTYVFVWLNKFEFNVLQGYFGYFLLGYWLNNIDIKKPYRYGIYVLAVIAATAIPVYTIFVSRSEGELDESWFSPSSLPVLLVTIGVFVLFKYLNIFEDGKKHSIIMKLSGYTFFVYMVHPFFLEKLNMIGINIMSFQPVWSIPIITICIIVLSVACAWIAEKIPLIGRVLIFF